MAFLFGRGKNRANTPGLSQQARQLMLALDGPESAAELAKADLAKVLAQMKLIVQGTHEAESSPEQVYQLVTGLIEEDLLYSLATHLRKFPFESRKDIQVIFSSAFRFRPPTGSPKSDPLALSYVVNNRPQVLVELCKGYEYRESAIPAGYVLREIIKNEAAAAIILYDEGEYDGSCMKGLTTIDRDRPSSGTGVFWKFFEWIDKSSFEVAADAFSTFRDLLTKHKELVPRYLAVNFQLFFRQVQQHPRPIQVVRHQAPVHQASGRDIAGPVQLQRHDSLC